MIATSIEEERDWDNNIKIVERNLNNAINRMTGKSPFELLHGYTPSFYDGRMRALTDEHSENPTELRKRTRERMILEQAKAKEFYDRRHCAARTYEIGQLVYIQRLPEATGDSTKLQPKYRGPYVVIEVRPHDTYLVSAIRSRHRTTAHASQMKTWVLPTADESVDDDDSSEDESPRRSKRILSKSVRLDH